MEYQLETVLLQRLSNHYWHLCWAFYSFDADTVQNPRFAIVRDRQIVMVHEESIEQDSIDRWLAQVKTFADADTTGTTDAVIDDRAAAKIAARMFLAGYDTERRSRFGLTEAEWVIERTMRTSNLQMDAKKLSDEGFTSPRI
jgi:hypothetical protein